MRSKNSKNNLINKSASYSNDSRIDQIVYNKSNTKYLVNGQTADLDNHEAKQNLIFKNNPIIKDIYSNHMSYENSFQNQSELDSNMIYKEPTRNNNLNKQQVSSSIRRVHKIDFNDNWKQD